MNIALDRAKRIAYAENAAYGNLIQAVQEFRSVFAHKAFVGVAEWTNFLFQKDETYFINEARIFIINDKQTRIDFAEGQFIILERLDDELSSLTIKNLFNTFNFVFSHKTITFLTLNDLEYKATGVSNRLHAILIPNLYKYVIAFQVWYEYKAILNKEEMEILNTLFEHLNYLPSEDASTIALFAVAKRLLHATHMEEVFNDEEITFRYYEEVDELHIILPKEDGKKLFIMVKDAGHDDNKQQYFVDGFQLNSITEIHYIKAIEPLISLYLVHKGDH
jgi:hypothetical protein